MNIHPHLRSHGERYYIGRESCGSILYWTGGSEWSTNPNGAKSYQTASAMMIDWTQKGEPLWLSQMQKMTIHASNNYVYKDDIKSDPDVFVYEVMVPKNLSEDIYTLIGKGILFYYGWTDSDLHFNWTYSF